MKKFIGWLLLTFLWISSTLYAVEKELLGAGATFPYPLYTKMFDVYYKENKVRINYQPIGSGGGIRQLINKTVDFGATDAFMSDEELKEAPAPILHIPICLGAVVVTYNLPGNPELKFTPEVLTDIFLGKIKQWDDPKIKKLNPRVKLPNREIVIVHRSDASGTTFIFTNYLSKVSKEWKKKVGEGRAVDWPTGVGAKGNAGVAAMIQQLEGSIGYVELTYALENKLPVAAIRNKKGKFITPTVKSTSASANIPIPADTRVSITNTDAADGYPLSGFTWIIVYKEQNYNNRTKETAEALVNLLWWMIHEGQKYAAPLHYAPLPKEAVKKAEKIVKSITYDGKPIIGKKKCPHHHHH